jgi:hypothetical protein
MPVSFIDPPPMMINVPFAGPYSGASSPRAIPRGDTSSTQTAGISNHFMRESSVATSEQYRIAAAVCYSGWLGLTRPV